METGKSKVPDGLEQKIKTFGVIISLPRKVARIINDVRKKAEEPAEPLVSPHITLITGAKSADTDRVKYFVAQAAAEVAPFSLTLYGVASFVPVAQVAFMPVAQGVQQVFELHRILLETPWLYEEKLDFVPHVTMAQDVPEENINYILEEFKDKSFTFDVDRIDLFELIGETWEKRGEYVLGQPQKKNSAL